MTTATGVFQFKSIAANYRAINLCSYSKNIKILEAAPMGLSSQLVVQGPSVDIETLQKSMRTGDLIRSQVFVDLDPRILKALLSLETSPLKTSLVTLEAAFLGDLFMAAQVLLGAGCLIVELRQMRSHPPHGYLVLTTDQPQSVESLLAKEEFKKLSFDLIEEIKPSLREFFDQ